MSSTKYAAALAGVTMLAASLYAAPAGATTASTISTTASAVAATAGSCGTWISSITAAGDLGGTTVNATKPPTRGAAPFIGGLATPPHLFPAGSARLSATWRHRGGIGIDFQESGSVVVGSTLYNASFNFGGIDGSTVTARVGGGWGSYKAIEQSHWTSADFSRERFYFYGLRNDGVLLRWAPHFVEAIHKDSYQPLGSYPGFSAVKAMTLISQTATYDTFLANTRSGGLYTIRIPVTSPMKVVVKQVRSKTWQSFEFLAAQRCGRQSTLLTGIDKDTKSAYLYAVSHATGATTVIQPLGKIPGTFPDPVYFPHEPAEVPDPLNGE